MWPFKKYTKIEIGNKKYIRPLATKKEIEKVEKEVFEKCNPFLGKIKDMSESEFEEFLNDAMFYDTERGIMMGQIPHKVYKQTIWFDEFEAKLWEEINERLDNISDDFFKIK
jgi:hypothetical protein